ncbi:hypothetical protein NXG27_13730 [Megasphaera paucivorans]
MNTREVTQQYRLNQWMEIIRECRSSGQSVASWCANHGVRQSSYYYWLKQIRVTACESFPALSTSKQEIVPLNIPSPSSRGADFQAEEVTSAIIVRFGAVTLELHNNASATLIENTLKALNNVR